MMGAVGKGSHVLVESISPVGGPPGMGIGAGNYNHKTDGGGKLHGTR